MAASSDKSDRDNGAAIGLGGAKNIASNLMRWLILVSVILFLFWVRYWQTCVVLVYVPSHLVWTLQNVVLLCVPSLVWTLWNVVLLCVPSIHQTFWKGVQISVISRGCWYW